MTVQQILDALTALNASLDTLIASKQVDLQPIADTIANIQTKVNNVITPAGG